MTFQIIQRPVPQGLAHIFATLGLPARTDTAHTEIDGLSAHLRRDLGLAATRQKITLMNEYHEKHSFE
ncbi:MAG: hypothetical protein QE284_00540 [Rhizobium sp.]|nr:hypothetical protein [Rhizobium sp.]